MSTVKIDDQPITTVQAWKYAQALNDGNLPAKIEAYLNATGHFCDEFTQTIDIDLSDTGTQFDRTFTLFEPVAVGRRLILHFTPSSCLASTGYIIIKMLEGATVVLWLKLDLFTGKCWYSTDDGANYSDANVTVTMDSSGYLGIWLQGGAVACWGYNATLPIGVWGTTGDIYNEYIVTGIDSVEVLSTADAHGYEGFGSYTPPEEITAHADTLWTVVVGAVDANRKFLSSASGGNYIDASNADAFAVRYSFPTVGTYAAGLWFSFDLTVTSLTYSGGQPGIFVRNSALSIPLQIQFDKYIAGNLVPNDLINQPYSGTFNIKVVFPTANTFDMYYNGTRVVNGGALLLALAQVAAIDIATTAGALFNATISNIVTSWATAGPDVDPVEVHVDEIWSDQDCIDPTDVRGRVAKIFNDDAELIWKGYVKDFQKYVQEGSVDYTLLCVDEFYQAARHDVAVSNIIHQSTVAVAGVDINEVTITDAMVAAPAQAEGKFMLLRHASGTIKYEQATGDYENLESIAFTPHDSGKVAITIPSGSHTDTRVNDGTKHQIQALCNAAADSDPGYVEYTLSRAVDATPEQSPVSGSIRISATVNMIVATGISIVHVYVYNKNSSTHWDHLHTMPTSSLSAWNVDASVNIPITENHVETTGGNWQVKVRFYLACSTTNVTFRVDVDSIRCDITCKKLSSFVPIESRIDIDPAPTTTVFQTSAIPVAEDISGAGDTAIICDSVQQALTQALSKMVGVTKEIDNPYLACPSDERGNKGFDAFKRLCDRYGLDFFLDVAAADTATKLQARCNKGYIDSAAIDDAIEIRNDPSGRWARHTTISKRVVVDKVSKVGSVIQFPTEDDGSQLQHDAVYYLLAADLDTAPSRNLKAFEMYFSFSGACVAGTTRVLKVYLSGTSDPNQGPYITLTYDKNGLTYWWHLVGISGATSCTQEEVESDVNNTIGIRVEIDYVAGTMKVYKRDVIVDVSRKLGDEWIELANCDDIVITEDPARSICFVDGSYGGVAAENYINLHLAKLEYVPEDFDGGAMTPGGDIDVQKKDDAVASLIIIGGKDANDVQIDPFAVVDDGVFDPAGRHLVTLMPSLKSEAEIKRYADDFVASYADDLNAIKMSKYIDNTSVFKCGYYYQFTVDGVNYDERLRRLEASWEPKSGGITYELEFGEGKTFGKEKLFNAAKRNDGDINELKLR
jgi:hypothetical protein